MARSRQVICESVIGPELRCGASSLLLLDGEVIGPWLCTRTGIRPQAVDAAWRTEGEAAGHLHRVLPDHRGPDPRVSRAQGQPHAELRIPPRHDRLYARLSTLVGVVGLLVAGLGLPGPASVGNRTVHPSTGAGPMRAAITSLTTATSGAPALSAAPNPRPATMPVPSTSK